MRTSAGTNLNILILLLVAWGISSTTAVFGGEFDETVLPFLQAHCVTCHGEEKQKADLQLNTLTPDFQTLSSAGHWIEVMDALNLGEMPPDKEPRPDIATQAIVTTWIATQLRETTRAQQGAGGRVLLRRLNRTEYSNTIRDLFGLTFLPGESPLELLPPDGTAEGFDKVSRALMLDSSLLENYFEVAARIAEMAIVDGEPEFPTQVMRFELEDTRTNRAISYQGAIPGFEIGEREVVLMAEDGTRSFGVMKYPGLKREIPIKGNYRIRVRAWGERAADGEPVIMRFTQDHPEADQQLFIETEVTDEPKVYEVVVPRDPQCGEYHVKLVNGIKFRKHSYAGGDLANRQRKEGQAGNFEEVLRLQSRQQMENLTTSRPNPEATDTSTLRKLFVDWIECEGPLYGQWPPRSHRTIFYHNGAPQGSEDIDAIFNRFMKRAFRGPVSTEEVSPVVALVRSEFAAGESFHNAVRSGLIAVLCSTRFLYIAEPSVSDTLRHLTDWELASRLSYFLWSSMPDDELFNLAESGKLSEPNVLSQQVDRMLADSKASGLVQGFGAQWLKTGDFLNFTPDNRLYRDYDAKLGESMVGEALAFFEEVLRNDESALSFIDSDWTMLNERLARFYGIDGVRGEKFQRVTLPADSPRGGLLGMAGIAMAGADGNRTKPVHRGVYVREVLFNDPPNPPPPNAGEVEPNIKGKNLTVRQRLIQHQQIASCAACHQRIDCYGLALENFNAIGAWRTEQDGEDFRRHKPVPIDSSSTLPNGESFGTFAEFKALLVKQDQRFARALTEKMLTYALGRPVTSSDRSLIDTLTAQMAEAGYTLRRLIHGVVSSDAFLTK